MWFVVSSCTWFKKCNWHCVCMVLWLKLSQNGPECCVKIQNFMAVHDSRLTAFSNYWIPKLYDSTQDLFSPLSTSTFRHPSYTVLEEGD